MCLIGCVCVRARVLQFVCVGMADGRCVCKCEIKINKSCHVCVRALGKEVYPRSGYFYIILQKTNKYLINLLNN